MRTRTRQGLRHRGALVERCQHTRCCLRDYDCSTQCSRQRAMEELINALWRIGPHPCSAVPSREDRLLEGWITGQTCTETMSPATSTAVQFGSVLPRLYWLSRPLPRHVRDTNKGDSENTSTTATRTLWLHEDHRTAGPANQRPSSANAVPCLCGVPKHSGGALRLIA